METLKKRSGVGRSHRRRAGGGQEGGGNSGEKQPMKGNPSAVKVPHCIKKGGGKKENARVFEHRRKGG